MISQPLQLDKQKIEEYKIESIAIHGDICTIVFKDSILTHSGSGYYWISRKDFSGVPKGD